VPRLLRGKDKFEASSLKTMHALTLYLFTAAALFCIGVAAIITRRNAVVVLMGIELMLNAANLNLVAFSRYDPGRLQGQLLALFVIVVAAAEAAVALAILLRVFAHFNTVDLDKVNGLKG
jgi:NADH-quinone oxidoreductase subunit K